MKKLMWWNFIGRGKEKLLPILNAGERFGKVSMMKEHRQVTLP